MSKPELPAPIRVLLYCIGVLLMVFSTPLILLVPQSFPLGPLGFIWGMLHVYVATYQSPS
jgi:hypothetical protein